jgi:hypothetical protein
MVKSDLPRRLTSNDFARVVFETPPKLMAIVEVGGR